MIATGIPTSCLDGFPSLVCFFECFFDTHSGTELDHLTGTVPNFEPTSPSCNDIKGLECSHRSRSSADNLERQFPTFARMVLLSQPSDSIL